MGALLNILLATIFPLVFVWSRNREGVVLSDIWIPWLLITVGTGLLWLLTWLLLGKWKKRSAVEVSTVATVELLLFFFYGSFAGLLSIVSFAAGPFGRVGPNKILFPLWCFAAVAVPFAALRLDRKIYTKINKFVTVMLTFLVVVNVFSIISYAIKFQRIKNHLPELSSIHLNQDVAFHPNIICVCLDAYPGAGTMQRYFGRSDHEFIDALESKGFQIPEARANYLATMWSLPSMLNINYLHEIVEAVSVSFSRLPRAVCRDLMENSRVLEAFRELDYRIYVTSTPYGNVQINNVDKFIAPWYRLGLFEYAVIKHTPIQAILTLSRRAVGDKFEIHRREILHNLNAVASADRFDEPFFFFMHLLCPHPPFVFDADGGPTQTELDFANWGWPHKYKNAVSLERAKKMHVDQVRYLEKEVLRNLDIFLQTERARDTIVVLFSDHGSGLHYDSSSSEETDVIERASNFIAIRFPGAEQRTDVPHNISLVNVFRIIFNAYFDAKLPLLQDRIFHISDKLQVTEVTTRAPWLAIDELKVSAHPMQEQPLRR